jgi:hypothetical protein
MSDAVELTLQFDPPVEAVDLRDRFQDLADEMDALVEDEDESVEQSREVRCDGGATFDYFVSQVRITTHGCVETGGDERESEPVYRGWTQVTADTLDAAVPETGVELETLLDRRPSPPAADGGVVETDIDHGRREEIARAALDVGLRDPYWLANLHGQPEAVKYDDLRAQATALREDAALLEEAFAKIDEREWTPAEAALHIAANANFGDYDTREDLYDGLPITAAADESEGSHR